MGQKVNPIGFRLGINRIWDSRWYEDKNYALNLHEDFKIRDYIEKNMKAAGISRVIIERPSGKAKVVIHAGRPGLIIGKKGADIEKLKNKLQSFTNSPVSLSVIEVRKPDIDAKLVAEAIATQLERRVTFRRAMKRAIQSAMRLGVKGIRVNCSGRLGGAEIARTEWSREGRVPLHTLRSNIDYAIAKAYTTYGVIGIKVWIYKGQILENDPMAYDNFLSEQR